MARIAALRAQEQVVRTSLVGGDLTRRSQNQLISDVEKLVDDYRRGSPAYSKSTAVELGERSNSSNDVLSRSNPRAASLYNSVSTFLSYDQRARYISAMSTATDNTLSKRIDEKA